MPSVDLFVDNMDNTVSVLADSDNPIADSLSDSQIFFEDGKFRLYVDGEYFATIPEEAVPEKLNNTIPVLGGN